MQLTRQAFRNSRFGTSERLKTLVGHLRGHDSHDLQGRECGMQVLEIKNHGGARSLALTFLRQFPW